MFKPTENIASDIGKDFLPDTLVTFSFRGNLISGTVVKQMTNSAIVAIMKTEANEDIIFQTNGNMVVSYDELQMK